MSKYDSLKILKKTRARVEHQCQNCGCLIDTSDFYYSLELSGRIHFPDFRRRAFCKGCYEKHGEELLKVID